MWEIFLNIKKENNLKALVKTKKGYGNVELIDIAEPICRNDEIKIRVKAIGICGTDLHIYEGDFPYFNTPVILGHEFTGEIVEIGKNIQIKKKFCINDRVVVLPSAAITCGKCKYCRSGFFICCPQRKGMGHGVDGGMVEYKCIKEDFVYKLPEGVSYDVGVLVEPLSCSVHAVDSFITITPNSNCLISGPGVMGLLVLSLLRLRNCKVALMGLSEDNKRFEVARKIGSDLGIFVDNENIKGKIDNILGANFFDISFECAGVPESVNKCITYLRKMGCLIQLGLFNKKASIDMNDIVIKHIAIYGSLGYTWNDWDKSMELIKRKELKLDKLITDIYKIEDWENAFKKAKNHDSLKVIFRI